MHILAAIRWSDLLTADVLYPAIRITLILLLGLPTVLLLSALPGRATRKRLSAQGAMLVRKGILYLGILAILISVLYQSGYRLTALLGAADIAGIAIGFASWTSVSNVISGLFLISERAFEVGDVILVGDTKGVILSIDLLSVKLRTFDNQFIRIPNETLIKSQATNITRFPVRRLDINVGVAYKEDPKRITQVLLDIAGKNPYSLDEPQPVVRFQNFGESGLEFLLAVWCTREDLYLLKSMIREEIKVRFDAEGIEIPFPHRSLYAGAATEPFPIRIVRNGSSEDKPLP